MATTQRDPKIKPHARVLHIMSSLEPSGMEMMLLASADQWALHGVTCDILSTASTLGSMAPRLQKAGYSIFHAPFRSSHPHVPSLAFLRRFLRLCRERQYDVVHIHTEAGPPVYALLSRLAGVPRLALTVHNTFRFRGLLRLRKSLERRLIRLLGGRYGMVSEAVARCEQEVFHNHGTLVLNWIDPERFMPPSLEERLAARASLSLPPTTHVLLSVGNCNHAKNHPALLHAMAALDCPSELLYLHVGREQQGRPERDLATHLNQTHRVRFCGSQQDIRTYLWASDLFVMPSLHEGLAIAPLEAIASGCPVLLGRVAGLIDFEPIAAHATFVSPEALSLVSAITRHLARPFGHARHDCIEDSAAVRSHFSPARGVSILCETLYRMPKLAETPSNPESIAIC